MTPAGTSNELDVQNEWEENTTHTHTTTNDTCILARLALRQCVGLLGSQETLHRPQQYHSDKKANLHLPEVLEKTGLEDISLYSAFLACTFSRCAAMCAQTKHRDEVPAMSILTATAPLFPKTPWSAQSSSRGQVQLFIASQVAHGVADGTRGA